VRQFLAALVARDLSASDRAFVARYLTPQQQALFERLAPADQQHAIAVARLLLDRGWADTALLQAALLHDIGKADSGLNLAYRTAIVLLRALWPAAFDRLAARDRGWRRPFYRHRHHPEHGACLVEAAGADPLVVELIRRHQEPLRTAPRSHVERLLAALQAADGVR
jgi:putative nucleotidyltransferase with HDIG domain